MADSSNVTKEPLPSVPGGPPRRAALARARSSAWIVLLALAACSGPSGAGDPRAEMVVVVHGLGRTEASMLLLSQRLAGRGYRVVSFGYPSREEPIESLVQRLAGEVERCCRGARRVHFVTHSMGGILVWRYLSDAPPPTLGRVVMLAPPAGGSEVVDRLAEADLVRAWLGPAGSRLGTGADDLPATLERPVDFELGVIAGERSLNPIGSEIIPGPDDGKVAVDRARVPGAADFLVIPATHTFIMNRRDVAEATARFLREGRFGRRAP